MTNIASLFYLDSLTLIMGILITFVSISVAVFSSRYLDGDKAQGKFYVILLSLAVTALILASADHMLLFLIAWGIGNILLAQLMIHKASWKAAKESGKMAIRNFAIGFICLSTAFGFLYAQTGEASIQAIINDAHEEWPFAASLSLIFIAAMTQSALWPFHRWLTSSLNAPTPVCAVMHAGLVNGGGFLLVRFAPAYFEAHTLLTIMFSTGLLTAFLGTLWKLMQSDVKRMLACSTMGQMGFMILQCGLGLFPAAIAHLVWHGLFKAYLFLASGSAAQEQRLDLGYPPRASVFALSLACGIIGTYAFSVSSHLPFTTENTTLFLIGMSFIAAAQLAMPILQHETLRKLPLAIGAVAITGFLYGLSVRGFDSLMPNLLRPQPLNAIHLVGLSGLILAWVGILFGRNPDSVQKPSAWLLKFYVWMLNASQPHPKTVTTHRNDYQYQ